MDISTINWPAVIVAALSNFLLGGLWYSPSLFGKMWAAENGLKEHELKTGIARVFGFSFLWSVVMSFNLAVFLNDKNTTASWGALAGFLAGFGWVAMAIFITGLFERKSLRYMIINAGYMTISFVIMGLILGAWR
jgi:Protein of unknown function (DUF1761)